MTPVVSVVISTFNRGAMVINAIESVLHQTYKDYEIIVIDGGSTDDTFIRVQPYLDRIQYLSEKDRGVSDGRNKGIKLARGEWIAILDSDDMWHPRKLELQMRTLGEMSSEFGVCFTNASFVTKLERGNTFFDWAQFHTTAQGGPLDDAVKFVLAPRVIFHTSTFLIRRYLIEEPNGFDTVMTGTEDTDLLFRLCFKTKFCFVNAALVEVDAHSPLCSGRLSSQDVGKSDQMFRNRTHMYKKWLLLLENQRDKELSRSIRNSLKLLYYWWLVTKMKKSRWADAIPLAKEIRRMGDSYCSIGTVLLARGIRSALRRTLTRIPQWFDPTQ